MINTAKKAGDGITINGGGMWLADTNQAVIDYIAGGGIVEDEFTPEELAQQVTDNRRAEIYARLDEIDLSSVRALRSKGAGRGKPQDDESLIALDDEAELLRADLSAL